MATNKTKSHMKCCVVGCKEQHKSLHVLPAKESRRTAWLHFIYNGRVPATVGKNAVVCANHFKTESFENLGQYTAGLASKLRLTDESVPTIRGKPADQEDVNPTSDLTEQLRQEVERLRRQIEELTSGIQRFCLGRFAASDDDIKFYTRFATYNHLMAFWRLIEPASHNMVRVSRAKAVTTKSGDGASHSASCQSLQLIDEFFLFMVHLSLGVPERDLAHRFNIDQTTVSQIISTWASFLYAILGSVRIWMSEEAVKAQLPKEFQDFPDTQVVIACTELRCQKTSRLLHEEGSRFTLKGLIGMAPHGAVTFVSSLYAGSLSDKEFVKKSGIVSLLKPEMAIMVNLGFPADDCVPCKVYRPAYLLKREHVPTGEGEVRDTQSIYRMLVHIQRLLCRVKKHMLFDTVITLPIKTVNQLHTVACLLINYQNGPLLEAWTNE